MSKNRRNHYRILHVQPEAPAEIIKAAYRTLMGPLRHHPDLGGDPEMAALINRAWEVLGDPGKRAAYDRTLARGRGRTAAGAGDAGVHAPRPATAPAGGASRATAGVGMPAAGPDPANWRAERCCPFCRAPLGSARRVETGCPVCGVPLSSMPASEAGRKELFGARGAVRLPKQHEVSMVPAYGAPALRVRMRDLSFTGLSLHSPAPVPLRQAIRVIDRTIEVVAVVVACRRRDAQYVVHAQLLTVKVERRPGAFMSMQA